MASIAIIQWCLDNLNYWTIGFLMTIESSFIPFPSEIVVPPAAYKAAAGELNICLVILSATAGALLGALVNYGISLWVGRPLIHKFVNSRIGHACLLNEKKLNRAEDYFVKYGKLSTFIGRLVPVVRQLISIPAGLSKMKAGPFCLYTVMGASVWNGILALIGYYLHAIVPKDRLMDKVSQYSNEISHVFLAAGIMVFGWLIYKFFKKSRNSKE